MFNKVVLGILISLVFSCAVLEKYDSLKEPKVSISAVDVADVSAKDIALNLKLNIDNPNNLPLKLDKITYALKVSGKDVTSGMIDQHIQIPANGQSDVVVPLKFQYSMLEGLISGLLKKTLTKDYELNGSAQIGILSIPFTKKGELKFDQ